MKKFLLFVVFSSGCLAVTGMDNEYLKQKSLMSKSLPTQQKKKSASFLQYSLGLKGLKTKDKDKGLRKSSSFGDQGTPPPSAYTHKKFSDEVKSLLRKPSKEYLGIGSPSQKGRLKKANSLEKKEDKKILQLAYGKKVFQEEIQNRMEYGQSPPARISRHNKYVKGSSDSSENLGEFEEGTVFEIIKN